MNKYVVISHTHWDREWYMPFEQFRLKLADLIDHLLGILERDDGFIFHLDAQTVVLEDYLEIRPEREEELKKYIASGNIAVGPWYLQNDFLLTSGEATVRNMMLGIELAERFGKCTRVAYAPDQFGNPAQLPQIFNGFGMDCFMFGRGYSFYDGNGKRIKKPAEFIWKSEDGSACIAVHLNQWYNNAQRIPEELENARLLLDINAKIFAELNVSPFIVLMNGVDHLEPQKDVADIVRSLARGGIDIAQMRMDDYFGELKEWLRKENAPLSEYTGALVHGNDEEVLRGCWSTRIYLKRANVRAQTALENIAEPLYAYMQARGLSGAWPRGTMRYIWKNLLRNHPHDSICGCSRDAVARHMEDSYERIGEATGALIARGMKLLSEHSDRGEAPYALTVFNPTERAWSGVAEAEIYFLKADGVPAFEIRDASGAVCPFCVTEKEDILLDVFSANNLPGVLNVTRYKAAFSVKDVPPFSSAHFGVFEKEAFRACEMENGIASGSIENEYYRLSCKDGKISLYLKERRETVEDFIRFEETGDCGNLYYYTPAGEPLGECARKAEVTEDTPLRKRISLRAVLRVPARYDFVREMRSEEIVEIPVRCTLTLRAGTRTLEISYTIDNKAEDHRIRILVGGKVFEEAMTVDSAFDAAKVLLSDACVLAQSKTFCNATFAAKRGAGGGFALFTEGQHEAESVNGGIALTLLRSSSAITRTAGAQWYAAEGQCKRTIEGRFGFFAFGEATDADLSAYAKQFRTGLPVYYGGKDPLKFTGGRFAVQDSKLAKYYPDTDDYAGASVRGGSLFTTDNANIAVTAVKQSEDGKGIAVRLVNLSSVPQKCAFSFDGSICRARLDESGAAEIGKGSAELAFLPKEIATLLLCPACAAEK